MPEQQLKLGDIVSLRSGGPRMTVATIDGQSALCEWFSDDQQPQSRSFALTSLKLDVGNEVTVKGAWPSS